MNSLRANQNSSTFSGHGSQTSKLEHGEFLFKSFTNLFNVYPVLADIQGGFGNDQKLRILCYQLSEYPTLMDAFKASVNNDHKFLKRALFGSWFSFVIAGQLKLAVSTTKDLFIAALIQDIAASGWQHLQALSPIFSEQAGSLNDNRSDTAQSVIIGRFLDSVPRLSQEVKSIVRSHHERLDGVGFLNENIEQQLSIAQQILIVGNEISVFCEQGSQTSFDFAAILPILKLNSAVYFRPVYSAVINVLAPSSIGSCELSPPLTNDVLDNQNQLTLRWSHFLKASAELTLLGDSDTTLGLKHIARRAWMLVTTSGILSDDISLWLSQLNDSGPSKLDNSELEVLFELNVLLAELNTLILTYRQQVEALTKDLNIDISESKRSLLIDLCYSMGEEQETFDLDEFTILNMCD